MNEQSLRSDMVMHAKSLFDRGYTCGGSGNISVRLNDGLLITPTNSCLGRLDPERISKIDWDGTLKGGDNPSKEWVLHQAVYRSRRDENAIVHLHSPHAVAVSCLDDLDPLNVLPPITPYFVMRIGRLPLVAYHPPGDIQLAQEVGRLAADYRAVLLARHGTVVSGKHLDDAVYTAEELEETARLFLLLQNHNFSALGVDEISELKSRFG